jgi:hypothetical protein
MECQDRAAPLFDAIPSPDPKASCDQTPGMAPNLATSQHELICNMIVNKSLKTTQMAEIATYSPYSSKSIRSHLRCFGTTKAPSNGGGRPRSITSPMLEALR